MNKEQIHALCALPQLSALAQTTQNADFSRLTSVKTGGRIAALCHAKGVWEFARLLALLKESGAKYFVLGNGSNILAPDGEYCGIAVKCGGKASELRLLSPRKIYCPAGVSGAALAAFAQKCGLSGAEFLSTFPTSIGGAVAMNAGCFGAETGKICTRVHAATGGKIQILSAADCAFSYRTSIFTPKGEAGEIHVAAAEFLLKPARAEKIAQTMQYMLRQKRASQPLNKPSFGSVFKRGENHFAGELIERAGLKGATCGGAQISPKHANFIVNNGGATTANIITLIELAKQTVLEKFGITLVEEVKYI